MTQTRFIEWIIKKYTTRYRSRLRICLSSSRPKSTNLVQDKGLNILQSNERQGHVFDKVFQLFTFGFSFFSSASRFLDT